MAGRFTGQSIERREDDRLLRGRGAFVGAAREVGRGHAAFVRSPHAHARVVDIDVDPCLDLDGVVAIYTY
jgi:aerobic carbon-monoxide dehydrogenase large subunit